MTTAALVLEVRRVLTLGRLADYLELTKPRIAVLVLITVVVGAFVAAGAMPAPWIVVHALLGTALVAGGASVLNHLFERNRDAQMPRTANRPLPTGRVSVTEAAVFAIVLFGLGVGWLLLFVNPLTALLGAVSWLLYVAVYTPLKSQTSLNTVVGAIPGALPVVMGWTAVGGNLGIEAFALFSVVFLWQFPHFLAIAWMYREEYAAAGLKMLPAIDPTRRLTPVFAVLYTLALIPVSLALTYLVPVGPKYFVAASLLGLAFLGSSGVFAWKSTEESARGLLKASLVYLPSLFVCLMADMIL